MANDEHRRHLQTALTELVHAAHQLAEALAYADLRERDPQVHVATASGHAVCALANLKQVRDATTSTIHVGLAPVALSQVVGVLS
jgi:hypothetical protein